MGRVEGAFVSLLTTGPLTAAPNDVSAPEALQGGHRRRTRQSYKLPNRYGHFSARHNHAAVNNYLASGAFAGAVINHAQERGPLQSPYTRLSAAAPVTKRSPCEPKITYILTQGKRFASLGPRSSSLRVALDWSSCIALQNYL